MKRRADTTMQERPGRSRADPRPGGQTAALSCVMEMLLSSLAQVAPCPAPPGPKSAARAWRNGAESLYSAPMADAILTSVFGGPLYCSHIRTVRPG